MQDTNFCSLVGGAYSPGPEVVSSTRRESGAAESARTAVDVTKLIEQATRRTAAASARSQEKIIRLFSSFTGARNSASRSPRGNPILRGNPRQVRKLLNPFNLVRSAKKARASNTVRGGANGAWRREEPSTGTRI
jgi:hypothetical protein